MKTSLFVVIAVLAVIPANVLGACPNSCSGNGRCRADDVCECYPNWMQGDCSERKCPYTKAWADVPDTSVTGREAHYYAECGNRGTCDRSSGECVCDDGFEGEGCDRLSCPGDGNCNGHGTCETLDQIEFLDYDGSTLTTYAEWDATKIQVCKCDAGWGGYACADRVCKLGNDPLTVFDSSGTAEVDEIQTVSITTTGTFTSTEFLLGYTDWRGEEWITRPIPYTASSTSIIAIREALLSLPMRAIDDIDVAVTTATTGSLIFTVTFISDQTPGDQPALNVYVDGCTVDGCQPYYTGMVGGTVTATVTETQKGTAERAVCSNRGICDSETGVCTCFSGFYGQACEKQTLVL